MLNFRTEKLTNKQFVGIIYSYTTSNLTIFKAQIELKALFCLSISGEFNVYKNYF